jgi:hypothetical protein
MGALREEMTNEEIWAALPDKEGINGDDGDDDEDDDGEIRDTS